MDPKRLLSKVIELEWLTSSLKWFLSKVIKLKCLASNLTLCLEIWRKRGVDGKDGKEMRVNENEGEWLPLHIVWIF